MTSFIPILRGLPGQSPPLLIEYSNREGRFDLEETTHPEMGNAKNFNETLDSCQSVTEIYRLAKRVGYTFLGVGRRGLRILQAELPLGLGAYHPVGSNQIVVNRRLLEAANTYSVNMREYNSFLFSIILHEYLHSLGYIDEYTVRRLVADLSQSAFGPKHPATTLARKGPWNLFKMRVRDWFGGSLGERPQGDHWIFEH